MNKEHPRGDGQDDRHDSTLVFGIALVCTLLLVGAYGLLVAAVVAEVLGPESFFWAAIATSVGVLCLLLYRVSRPTLSKFDRWLLRIDDASSAGRQRYTMLLKFVTTVVVLQVMLLLLYRTIGME